MEMGVFFQYSKHIWHFVVNYILWIEQKLFTLVCEEGKFRNASFGKQALALPSTRGGEIVPKTFRHISGH